METVIFTGLLISGYLANECNNDTKHNKKIKNRLNKKTKYITNNNQNQSSQIQSSQSQNQSSQIQLSQNQSSQIQSSQNQNQSSQIQNQSSQIQNQSSQNQSSQNQSSQIQNQSSQNQSSQEEINNELQDEINNELQDEINRESIENNILSEPVEYNGVGSSFNINELDDDISGRKKLKRTTEKFISNLTGNKMDFAHNNMQPFFGSTATQNMDLDNPIQKLDIFTGGNTLKKPKKETEPLFEPEQQNIFGMQNYAEQYKKNINQSKYENHNLPFEQVKIGPGVGLDYDDGPTGGFQQDVREYQMPKTVDDLRAKNNPRVSYKGRIIKGQKEIKRDSEYYFTKNKHAIMAVDKTQFPTSGVEKETKRSDIYIKNNNRKISKEVMGPASSVNSKEYKKQDFRQSDKLELEVDTTRNITGDKKYDFDKKNFNCVESKREEQAPQQFNKGLYIGNLLKALIPTAQYQDTARQTIRETTEVNKELLNLKGGSKITMYNKQPARSTIRETTENNVKDIINIKLYNKLPERVKQKVKTTLRETLLDNNHSGYITVGNKKTPVRNLDKLKATLKETLLKDSELLNMLAGYRGTKQFEDLAKLTHKETYTQNYNVGGAGENRNDGYKTANMEMVETNRENTCDHEYIGIGDRENATGYMTNEYEAKETNKETYVDKDYYGTGLGDKEMMSYEDMYNATINELKEGTLKGRAPTKEGAKTAISSKDINMDINCDLLRKGEEPKQKTLIHNTILDKTSIVSTSNKTNSIEDVINYNQQKRTTDITDQLDKNPFAISIV